MFDEQLRNLPANPPRAFEALPGLKLSRAIRTTALLFPLVFVIFFLSVPLSIMRADPFMRFAISPSRSIQARVLTLNNVSACRSDKAHRVIYQFSPKADSTYRGAATICEQSIYYTSKPGDAVEVQYLKNDPVVSRLRGNNPPNATQMYLYIFTPLFILVMFGSLFLPPAREYSRARRLFRRGQLTTGTVLFVKKRSNAASRGWSGNTSSDVFIQFTSIAGHKREGVAWCPNDWLVDQLVVGGEVHIAYDDRSDKILLLEAFVR